MGEIKLEFESDEPLSTKGTIIVYSEDEFSEIVHEYDIAWVISNTGFRGDEEKFIKAVEDFMKEKKSLMFWGDSCPFHYHMNLILN